MPLPRFVDYTLRFIAPISLALAIYYHYQSVQERAPTYYVSPARARIVDTTVPALPQLQVLYSGKVLNTNVSATIVYFWNDGKLPIKAEDVLEPLRIELESGCEILDARILKVSRPVTNLAKGEISDAAKNVLPLSFRILERNDGAALQIIYSGKPDTPVSVTGTVIGVKAPQPLAPDEKTFDSEARRSRLKTQLGASFILVIIGSVLLGTGTDRLTTRFLAKYLNVSYPPAALQFRPRHWIIMTLGLAIMIGGAVFGHNASKGLLPGVPDSIWLKQ